MGYFTVGGGQSRVRGIIYFLFVDYYKSEGRGNIMVCDCACVFVAALVVVGLSVLHRMVVGHSRGFASIIKI